MDIFFNQGKVEEADRLFSENYVFHNPLGIDTYGIEAVKAQIILARNAFNGFFIDAHEIMADKDMVVTRFTTNGTQVGEFMGVPATGNSTWKDTGRMVRYQPDRSSAGT